MRGLTDARRVLVLPLAFALLTGCASSPARLGASTPARAQAIDVGLTLGPGSVSRLFSVRGYHYGIVGRFVAGCDRSGLATTRYVLTALAPDALVAVDGRIAADGARFVSGESLHGGRARSGIEHWIIATGGEPEEIRLDASLLVVSAVSASGYCEFSLHGTSKVTPH